MGPRAGTGPERRGNGTLTHKQEYALYISRHLQHRRRRLWRIRRVGRRSGGRLGLLVGAVGVGRVSRRGRGRRSRLIRVHRGRVRFCVFSRLFSAFGGLHSSCSSRGIASVHFYFSSSSTSWAFIFFFEWCSSMVWYGMLTNVYPSTHSPSSPPPPFPVLPFFPHLPHSPIPSLPSPFLPIRLTPLQKNKNGSTSPPPNSKPPSTPSVARSLHHNININPNPNPNPSLRHNRDPGAARIQTPSLTRTPTRTRTPAPHHRAHEPHNRAERPGCKARRAVCSRVRGARAWEGGEGGCLVRVRVWP